MSLKPRMPVARDIRVHSGDSITPSRDAVLGAELASSTSSPELVTVTGFGKNDVLFRSDKANCIQVRDGSGMILALLIRLKPGIWGFSKRGDKDWNEVLAIYGNPDKE